MAEKTKGTVGFYREAVDIRKLNAGPFQIAPDMIIKIPRPGMYKLSASVLLVEMLEEPARPAITDVNAELAKSGDPRGDNVWQFPPKPPTDPDTSGPEVS